MLFNLLKGRVAHRLTDHGVFAAIFTLSMYLNFATGLGKQLLRNRKPYAKKTFTCIVLYVNKQTMSQARIVLAINKVLHRSSKRKLSVCYIKPIKKQGLEIQLPIINLLSTKHLHCALPEPTSGSATYFTDAPYMSESIQFVTRR